MLLNWVKANNAVHTPTPIHSSGSSSSILSWNQGQTRNICIAAYIDHDELQVYFVHEHFVHS